MGELGSKTCCVCSPGMDLGGGVAPPPDEILTSFCQFLQDFSHFFQDFVHLFPIFSSGLPLPTIKILDPPLMLTLIQIIGKHHVQF